MEGFSPISSGGFKGPSVFTLKPVLGFYREVEEVKKVQASFKTATIAGMYA
jgi:hypothetical protein